MAGVKGRSGGARPNSGGKRPGAGRKPKSVDPKSANSAAPPRAAAPDMLTFLQEVALGLTDATTTQVRAAIAAVQYTHTKKGDGGKKDEQAAAAKSVANAGRFAASAPPLKLVNGKK